VASFAYGYPPDLFQVYLDKNLMLSEAEEAKWRQELLAFGVLRPGGQMTYSAQINSATEPILREVTSRLLANVLALARYPLRVQASVEGTMVTAELLDESGRTRFQGTDYGSASGAAKAASGWVNANGWTFWHYFDESSGQWRPINNLRNRKP
jgi:hypothetical protein